MAIWACAVTAAPLSSSASETELNKDLIVIGFPPFCMLKSIVAGPVATSMRKRVEFPVRLDLPPAVREPIRLEHQKSDDDQPDRDLAQKCDVVVERQRPVDRAAFQTGADPLHRFR